MEKQEIFDSIVDGLIRQGKKSLDRFGDCAYRGVDGTRCAAGFLIDDAEYDSIIETIPWCETVDKNSDPEEIPGIEHLAKIRERVGHKEFVSELQFVHDGSEPVEWVGRFRQIATKHNLELPSALA